MQTAKCRRQVRRCTLLALLAVLLAAVAWSAVTVVRFNMALAGVAELGGHVIVRQSPAFAGSRVMGWYSLLIGDARVIVDLHGTRAADADLVQLRALGAS